jgi:hypothetical protein
MGDGSGALNDVYAKLDWATTRHDELLDRFEEFAKPGGGDERPYGIKFHEHDRALHGLDECAVDFIYGEQPLHWTPPEEDPLVILNKLDNMDKHRLLSHAFVYPGVERGLDLIEVREPRSSRLRPTSGLQASHS